MKTNWMVKLNSIKRQRLLSGPITGGNRPVRRLASTLATLWFGLTLLPTAKAGSFIETGAMSAPRWGHKATLLPDGKVLVIGGWLNTNGSDALTATAEVYNPASGIWTTNGAINVPRYNHTATLLPNGRVLVAGGRNEAYAIISSAEVYDPATGTSALVDAMMVARNVHSATLLPNGKVLIAGGCDYSVGLSSCELYDPTAGTWTNTTPMNNGRGSHPAVLLSTGKVLVAAGWNGDDLSSAELYDPATGVWTRTGGLSTSINDPVSVALPNGQALLTGGYSHACRCVLSLAELYDPSTGIWTKTNAMTSGRGEHTVTVLPSGKVLAAGLGSVAGVSAELYDPAQGTWTATGPMKTGRYYHTATLLHDGNVLLAGGGSVDAILSSAELYISSLPLQIAPQPQSQIGYWGKSVSFVVGATNGTPPYSFQWRKDDVEISGATNSLLVLTNLQSTDRGVYTVLVSDTVTSILSQGATLTVNPAGVSIALYAGVTIDGVAGQTYGIQATDLSNTNSWVGVANVMLNASKQIWYDSQPATQPQRYYRVVPGPISIP